MTNETKSETPRTDRWMWEAECNFDVPWEEHCATLETELNATKAENENRSEALAMADMEITRLTKERDEAVVKFSVLKGEFDDSRKHQVLIYGELEKERDELRAKLTEAEKVLTAIRDMPDYDQDNEHRLRNMARQAIDAAKGVNGQ